MNLNEFDTPKMRFAKVQSYLKENYGCEIKTNGLSLSLANRMIKQSKAKLSKLNEKKNPKEYGKTTLIVEGLQLWKLAPIQTELTHPAVREGVGDAIEEAKVILAAKEMEDQLQKMVEDLAEMQVQTLMPLVDAMKAEIGTSEAEQFNSSVDSVLGELLDRAKETKDAVTNAILTAGGNAPVDDMAGFDSDVEMGPDLPDMDDDGMDSEFGDIDADLDFDDGERELKIDEEFTFESALKELKHKSKNGKVAVDDITEMFDKISKKDRKVAGKLKNQKPVGTKEKNVSK